MRTPLHPVGSRVRVRRGKLPIDSRTVGRTGLVVRTQPYEPHKFVVLLDGDDDEREFTVDELEREGAGDPASPSAGAAG